MTPARDRVEEYLKRAPEVDGAAIAGRPLSRLLRHHSWPDHARAETSDYAEALVDATIDRPSYADLLVQLREIYTALEARAEELGDDPVASPVIDLDLNRTAGIEQDLAFYVGEDWRSGATPLGLTMEYAHRIRRASPERFVVHHYTRYLADLSGNQDIGRALTATWNLNGGGRAYYAFPTIPDPVAYKAGYRARLDTLPVTAEQRAEMVRELFVGYGFNIDLFEELQRRTMAARAVSS